MTAARHAGWAAVVLAAASLGLVGLPGPPSAAAPLAVHKQPVNHSNVGRPHSPQLLRRLAGPAGGKGAGPAALGRQVIAGAVQGVDVASYQHPGGAAIDWATVASDGIRFAAVKATEGDYYTNPYGPADLTGARNAGLSTVAYAFGIPNGNGSSASPTVQADDLVSYLTGKGVSPLPPVMLDIEYNPYGAECYGLTKSAMVSWINGFSAEVKAKTGRVPIIYSTEDWLATCTGNSTALGSGPLWIAQYASIPSPSPLPANWTDWGIWQYSSTGTVSGIPGSSSNTDLDQLNPDSFIAPGKLLVFNPGPRHTAPGGAASGQLEAYAEEAGPAVSYRPATMPSWLSLDTSTGQLTGTAPSTPGSYPVTVTASDSTSGASGPVSFTWDTGVSSGACGSVLLAGSQWLRGLGVDVDSNGPDQGTATSCGGTSYVGGVPAGSQWQAAELVNRLYLTRGWISTTWPGKGGDSSPASHDSMYDQAPASLTRQPNGSLSYLGPGDVVSVNAYDGGVFVPGGQAFIVDPAARVTSGTVNLVSQNDGSAGDAVAITTATLTQGTLTVPGAGGWTYSVIGVVHAPTWVAGETALPADASPNATPWLASMSCPTVTSCAAAGYYSAGAYQGLLLTGSGITWQATEAPLPAGATGSTLQSVACISATSCVAVGSASTPGGYLGMLLTGSQASWQAQTVPVPANAAPAPGDNPALWGVACPAAASCVVAGEYDSTSASSAMLLTGSGSSWTATEAPVPANAGPGWGVQLRSVACPSTTSCVAAGQYFDPTSGYEQGLLVTGSGTTWTATETPLPANAAAKPSVTLSSVTCPSTISCIVTGEYFDSAGNEHGLLLTGSGTTWQAIEAPLPANAAASPGASLTRAACTSAISCVATGMYTDSAGHVRALLVTGSGTSWQAADVPLPLGAATSPASWLDSVACHAGGSCEAVGHYQDRSGRYQALVVTGSGTSWQAAIVPLPADAGTSPNARLTGVACPGTTWCVAAGGYFSSTGEKLLLETGSASTQALYPILASPASPRGSG